MDNRNEKKGRDEILKKYEYLDDLSLNGYLWEFIRRNREYKKAYEEYQKNKNYWLEPVYDPPKNKNECHNEKRHVSQEPAPLVFPKCTDLGSQSSQKG